jgi:hypothetical protein
LNLESAPPVPLQDRSRIGEPLGFPPGHKSSQPQMQDGGLKKPFLALGEKS